MKTLMILIAVATLSSACTSAWPTASEKALSAREDARDRAMAELMQHKTK